MLPKCGGWLPVDEMKSGPLIPQYDVEVTSKASILNFEPVGMGLAPL